MPIEATISSSRRNTRRSRVGRSADWAFGGLFLTREAVLMAALPPRGAPHVGRIPGQVLAAVEGDHLPGHGRGAQDEADRIRDLLRRRAAAQDGGLALAAELLVGLVRALQDRPGPDG